LIRRRSLKRSDKKSLENLLTVAERLIVAVMILLILEYDVNRTWVIDKPNIPKTPQGFKRILILRKDYSKLDSYYITPTTGKKLRTRNEIAAYLKDHPELTGVSASDFDFSSPKIMQDIIPEYIEQSANKKLR
jgi:hypothetical protein